MKSKQSWFLPILLLVQGLFLGSTFGTTAASLVLFGLLTLIGVRRRKKKRAGLDHSQAACSESVRSEETLRATQSDAFWGKLGWFVLLIVVAALVSLWRFQKHFGETFNPVAFFVDAFAHVCFVLGLLFYCKRPRFGHPAMLGLGLLVVMLSAASGASSQTLTSQVTVALLGCIGFLFASRFILPAWHRDQRLHQLSRSGGECLSFHSSTSERKSLGAVSTGRSDGYRIGWLFSAVMLSLFLMATSVLANVTGLVLPEIQRIVHDQLKSSFDAVVQEVNIGSSHYVSGSRLGSIRRHMVVDPTEIALHARSKSQPGYLRGNVFDIYSAGRWDMVSEQVSSGLTGLESFRSRAVASSGVANTPVIGLATRKLRHFDFLPRGESQLAVVQIENDPLKGHVFFSPLSTRWIEAQGRQIHVDSHGIIEHGINTHFPYIAGVGFQPVAEPMGSVRRNVLTYVNDSMLETVSGIASEVCAGQLTNISKANAIQRHFKEGEGYEYSLQGVPVPGRDDPLLHFLTTKHPAHCELYASATVLMLRSVNVPARYVTGYIVDEFSTEEDSWVARNRDAHAWVEAYDDLSETWFPVEATPGHNYQTLTLTGDEAVSLADTLGSLDAEASDNQTLIGRAIGWVLSKRATDPLTLLIQLGQWPLFVMGVFLLWRRLRRGNDSELSADDLRSRRMLASVDRKVQRLSLQRSPSETLHQFADRLEHQANAQQEFGEPVSQTSVSDWLLRYAIWYRDFANARYQGQSPQPFSATS